MTDEELRRLKHHYSVIHTEWARFICELIDLVLRERAEKDMMADYMMREEFDERDRKRDH